MRHQHSASHSAKRAAAQSRHAHRHSACPSAVAMAKGWQGYSTVCDGVTRPSEALHLCPAGLALPSSCTIPHSHHSGFCTGTAAAGHCRQLPVASRTATSLRRQLSELAERLWLHGCSCHQGTTVTRPTSMVILLSVVALLVTRTPVGGSGSPAMARVGRGSELCYGSKVCGNAGRVHGGAKCTRAGEEHMFSVCPRQ